MDAKSTSKRILLGAKKQENRFGKTIALQIQILRLKFVLNARAAPLQIIIIKYKVNNTLMCLEKIRSPLNKLQPQIVIPAVKIEEDLDGMICAQVDALQNVSPIYAKSESKTLTEEEKSASEAENSKNKKWSKEEQEILFEKYEEHGPKWSFFATIIPNKTQNTIKNRFYGAIRKLLRRINSVGKKAKKLKKMISYESIMRPLESAELGWDLYEGFREQNLQIKHMIVSCSKSCPQNLPEFQSLELISKIHKFNLMTRCFSLKKTKKEIHDKKKCVKEDIVKLEAFEEIEPEDHQVKFQEPVRESPQENENLDLNVLLNDEVIEQLYNQYNPQYRSIQCQWGNYHEAYEADYVEGLLMQMQMNDPELNNYHYIE